MYVVHSHVTPAEVPMIHDNQQYIRYMIINSTITSIHIAKQDRVCYAVDTAGGRDPNQYKPLQWTGAFQLLGYKDTYLGLKRKCKLWCCT